jgi:hypothetical protein
MIPGHSARLHVRGATRGSRLIHLTVGGLLACLYAGAHAAQLGNEAPPGVATEPSLANAQNLFYSGRYDVTADMALAWLRTSSARRRCTSRSNAPSATRATGRRRSNCACRAAAS